MYTDYVLNRVREIAKGFAGDGCWIWPMSTTKAGYGQLGYKKPTGERSIAYAHRAAFAIFVGDVADGMEVCHKCDNPACFNPAHMFCGTHKENMHDMHRKNRSGVKGRKFPQGDKHWSKARPLRGSSNGNSRLTEEIVTSILQSKATGASLAAMYGVSNTIISKIRLGRIWPHITRPYLSSQSG